MLPKDMRRFSLGLLLLLAATTIHTCVALEDATNADEDASLKEQSTDQPFSFSLCECGLENVIGTAHPCLTVHEVNALNISSLNAKYGSVNVLLPVNSECNLTETIQIRSCGRTSAEGARRRTPDISIRRASGHEGDLGNMAKLQGAGNVRLIHVLNGCNLVVDHVAMLNGGSQHVPTRNGSAIVVDGPNSLLMISNSVVQGGTGHWGGGLLVANDACAEISNCRFEGNTAVDDGYTSGSPFDFSDVYGLPGDMAGLGGAIAVHQAQAKVTDSVFIGNHAVGSHGQPPNIKSTTFLFGGGGGALAVLGAWGHHTDRNPAGHATCTRCTFIRNTASGGSDLDTSIGGNFVEGMSGLGGAIIVLRSSFAMHEGKIEGNSAYPADSMGGPDGGAVLVHGGVNASTSYALFEDVDFVGNAAYPVHSSKAGLDPGGEGGSVMVLRANSDFVRCRFMANQAQGFLPSPGSNVVGGGANGGAVVVAGTGEMILQPKANFINCVFSLNGAVLQAASRSPSKGGALYIQRSVVLVKGCKFWQNRADGAGATKKPDGSAGTPAWTAGRGGALHALGQDTQLSIQDTVFDSNSASSGLLDAASGGAMFSDNIRILEIKNCVFRANEASNQFQNVVVNRKSEAGGLFALIATSSVLALKNVTFQENFAGVAPSAKIVHTRDDNEPTIHLVDVWIFHQKQCLAKLDDSGVLRCDTFEETGERDDAPSGENTKTSHHSGHSKTLELSIAVVSMFGCVFLIVSLLIILSRKQ